MKRLIALFLSFLMLLTLAVGCGEAESKPEPLTDSRITADLAKGSGNYAYTHVSGTPTISDFTILSREEKENRVYLTLSATAVFSNADVALKANMEYARIGSHWRLSQLKVTEHNATFTGAPDLDSVRDELENYYSIAGSAYAILGDEYQVLYGISVYDATAEMQYEDGAETALLKLSYTSDKLSYEGSYTITLGEGGWTIETVKQDDDRYHPLMHLTKLKKK